MLAPRTFVVVAAAGALLVVVAAASGSVGHPAAGSGGTGLGVPDGVGDLVVGAVAALWTLGVFEVAHVFRTGVRSGGGPPRLRERLWGLLVVPVVFAAVWLYLRFTGKVRAPVQRAPFGYSREAHHVLSAPSTEGLGWAPVAGGAGAAVLAIVVFSLASRARRSGRLRPGAFPAAHLAERRREAVGAVDISLEALEAEPDARKAVIAAYRSMEHWFARAGTGRHPWEAPFEHLERAMADLGVGSGAGVVLAGLYEQARFSQHRCGPEMKRAALNALTGLRDDLQHATPSSDREPAQLGGTGPVGAPPAAAAPTS